MHTNDTHANVQNAPKRVTAVKEVRASKPNAVLVDAGDVFSGTLYFNEFKGLADIELMNLMKYDMMTFGNHEFDLGGEAEGNTSLANFVKAAKFPFVSANVDFSKDKVMNGLQTATIAQDPKDGHIYNAIIKEVDGEKVGFFGLTTEETVDIASPGSAEFNNYIKSAEQTVAALEKQGIDKIVAVSHIGYDDNAEYDNDLLLAANVEGIDVIVGGHSHTKLSEPVVVNKDQNGVAKDPTVIVQAYQYSDFLGTIDVEFDENGVVVGQAGELIKLADKAEDKEAAEILKPYTQKVEDTKNKPTGATTEKALTNPRVSDDGNTEGISVRANETELGNLITDSMLASAQKMNPNTVIAVQNGGGIRAGIDAGPITLGDVLTVMPFGNTLATMNLTGAEILEALEHSVSQAPKESGGFLHVSGMKFTYDSSKAAGSRVVTAQVNEKGTFVNLDPAKTYVVATNAFTAKGGDGFDVFNKAYESNRVTDYGQADWETFSTYLSQQDVVKPQIEGRIVDVAKKAQ
ncbi:bifunctional metallophosphatase/5'-nucleotidase [Bacillus sp. JJ722]|uniref:bifunctional metallophosphatase/5'-nucleotidase n=1 Tax=Bacillus sp. JJ722 TaxID=3122973 RepID=UPI002FFF5374